MKIYFGTFLIFAIAGSWVYPIDNVNAQALFESSSWTKQETLKANKNDEKRRPAGPRGDCSVEDPEVINSDAAAVYDPMTPLLPLNNDQFTGMTVETQPSFWFYVPETSGKLRKIQFLLDDDATEDEHYSVYFAPPAQAGLVRIQLPEGKEIAPQPAKYRWYFKLYCVNEDSLDNTTSVFHTGTIERVQLPNLAAQLSGASLEKRIKLRAEKELWYDVTDDLVDARQQPDAWRRLLEVLDLTGVEKLEQAPVVELVPLAE